MKTTEYKIPLDKDIKVIKCDLKSATIEIEGVEYIMKCPYCTIKVEGDNLLIQTTSKWRNKVYSIVRTWMNKIEKLKLANSYIYKVRWVYRKFPINLEWDEENHALIIKNYFGYKSSFRVRLNPEAVEFVKIEQDTAVFRSKDDEKAGSEIALFNNLRRFINRNLDRRVFEDGILIEKLIENR